MYVCMYVYACTWTHVCIWVYMSVCKPKVVGVTSSIVSHFIYETMSLT